MSYIDAFYDRREDTISVVERVNGERIYRTFPVNHVLYYSHPSGSHRSIFNDPCKKFVTQTAYKFKNALHKFEAEGRTIFESDINPVFRSLSENYHGVEAPELNIGLFDIEVDFSPEFGFAPTDDPFNAVTAITLWHSKWQKLTTLVLCPPTYSVHDAQKIVDKFDNTILFTDEADLLTVFLDLIEDIDVLSGWNSEGYDIPYLVNRMRRIMGEEILSNFCLWGKQPLRREYIKFNREHVTYDLVGRIHLDYLLLYQKHVTQQLHSYRLDYVGEIEVNENKIPYEGTLDDLYKKDFEKFIAYNRQDVDLLVKIDQKLKYIELSNQVAHANCVLLKTTMGSVALVEQAIINEMHEVGVVVPNRPKRDAYDPTLDAGDDDAERKSVAGAYVIKPKVGLHKEIGAVDLNSLYPSTIRALNLSPETIIGQIRPTYTDAYLAERMMPVGKKKGMSGAEAWDGLFGTLEYKYMMERNDKELIVDFDDGTTATFSGEELWDYIFNPANHVCISANGTIFRTDIEGMIPALLAKWYSQRKEMQRKKDTFKSIMFGVKVSEDIIKQVAEFSGDVDEVNPAISLGDMVKNCDISGIVAYIREFGLEMRDGLVKAYDNARAKVISELFHYWDQRQQARKILLNSLYGALLNEGLRFYDKRLGQSVTLTGRCITKHMGSSINETITGKYDNAGDAIIYGDTDSIYFSAYHVLKDDPRFVKFEWSRENIIDLYDNIGEEVNKTFPKFMDDNFNTGLERGAIIAAGREIVASMGLFIKKKKYACLVYDDEGKRVDVDGKPGKLKAMGLDLKRADTPKFMQKFLERILLGLLTEVNQEEMYKWVRQFRIDFKARPGWEKGSPKAVKALDDYTERHNEAINYGLYGPRKKGQEKGKINMPGHVRAAMNWNNLCESNADRYSMRISDGFKTIVCKLKPNVMGIKSIAYPIDEPHIPKWFKELPFDHALMEDTIIDKKLDNLVGVLPEWDLSKTRNYAGDEYFVFG